MARNAVVGYEDSDFAVFCKVRGSNWPKIIDRD